jgi:hypothetical protein
MNKRNKLIPISVPICLAIFGFDGAMHMGVCRDQGFSSFLFLRNAFTKLARQELAGLCLGFLHFFRRPKVRTGA